MYPYKSSIKDKTEQFENNVNVEIAEHEHKPPHKEEKKRMPPAFRPPKTAPNREHSMRLVNNRRGLRRCEGHLAYLWLRSDKEHWMYVTHVGAGAVYGYTWTHGGWQYSGFDTRFIEAFYCFG